MVPAEWNYKIYDKEMLAVIRALEDWRHYLEGLPRPFTIVTDHRNLKYWRSAQNLSHRQARWSLYLSRFDFQITHKPGATNTQADPLSRTSTHLISDADNNRDQLVLRWELFVNATATTTQTPRPLEDEIRHAVDWDPEVILALKTLQKPKA